MGRRCLYHDIMDMEFMVEKEASLFFSFPFFFSFLSLFFLEFSTDGRHREGNGRFPEADLGGGGGGATVGEYRCRTLS